MLLVYIPNNETCFVWHAALITARFQPVHAWCSQEYREMLRSDFINKHLTSGGRIKRKA